MPIESFAPPPTALRFSFLGNDPFRNAEVWGRLTRGEKERGNAAYSNYRTAFDEALQAANGNYNAPTPDNVKTLANEAIRILSSILY